MSIMHTIKKYKWTSLVIILFASFCILELEIQELHRGVRSHYSYDMAGYWSWLPLYHIYQDYDIESWYEGRGPHTSDQFVSDLQGHPGVRVNKYSPGTSLLQMPFYFIAHKLSRFNNPESNGFESSYKYSTIIGAIFYSILALILIALWLSRRFSDEVIALTLVILSVGNVYTYYVLYNSMLSHGYSFFLMSLFVYLVVKWQEDKKHYAIPILGLCLGLIIAIRLSNALICFLPLLWGVKKPKDILDNVKQLFSKPLLLFPALVFAILPSIPNIHYLHSLTGEVMISGYSDWERFYWLEPLFHKVLFSFTKGYYIYSPLLIIGLFGIYRLRKYHSFIPISIFLILHLYLLSSWYSWWYGGSYGMRAMVETTSIYSIFIASAIEWIIKKKWRTVLLILCIAFGTCLNVVQMYQMRKGLLHWDGMTYKSYKALFLKTKYEGTDLRENVYKNVNSPKGYKAAHDAYYRRHLKTKSSDESK